MEEITTGLKICPKCRHLMIIKQGKTTCPKCDRKELENELKAATKKIGNGISRRTLNNSNLYIMMHAKSGKAPYVRAKLVKLSSNTPIAEIDQKCQEWAKDGVGSWVLLCMW